MRNVKRKVYYVLFVIVCSALLINCQGSGGGGGGGGSGGHIRHTTNNGSGGGSRGCVGNECWLVLGLFAGGSIGIGICGYSCYRCYHSRKGRPMNDNSQFVSAEPSHQQYTPIKNVFRTGMWSSRYGQYGSWHGPHQLHLSFNPHSMAVDGSGLDDVGEFTIDGIFSDRTLRMGLTKYYKQGTGNGAQNLGHSVIIQVSFDAESKRFEGKWYIQTKKYHGEDVFELKCDAF